jgi:hypothetical protein
MRIQDPGWKKIRIRDPGWNKFGSGINIPDPQHCFWRARECWPLLCFCRPFCISDRCLDSNPESCRSKKARYQLSHPSPYLITHLPQTDKVIASIANPYGSQVDLDLVRYQNLCGSGSVYGPYNLRKAIMYFSYTGTHLIISFLFLIVLCFFR